MGNVNLAEAKADMSKLVEWASAGDTVRIVRWGRLSEPGPALGVKTELLWRSRSDQAKHTALIWFIQQRFGLAVNW